MYSDKDFTDIRNRIRANRLIWIPATLIMLALWILALILRIPWLNYLGAAATVIVGVFGFTFHQLPCLRYQKFLMDVQNGLSREMTGQILSISDDTQLQDGVRVRSVHIELEDGERIIYLNDSKKDGFPPVGAMVHVTLCGRHIVEMGNGEWGMGN